ncbi:hypothetical protein HUG10_19795 (plasmid) [Halorarum halophilum]|uniref:Uncharacterized protein n=1 Tax=Halorarum halophilum TaxID=2743090 RepID=A0A7D5KI99_9EURY|nr:hypothetical protein [Halobaculum halophilum]QLG29856.1 hypothetical protein HUG10_19795 [Halobaculum halophilum]
MKEVPMKIGNTILDCDGNELKVREQANDCAVTLRKVDCEDEMTAPYFLPKRWLSGTVRGEKFLSFADETVLEDGTVLVDSDGHRIQVENIDDSDLVSLADFEDETIYYLEKEWVENAIEGCSSFEMRRDFLPFLKFSEFDLESEQ